MATIKLLKTNSIMENVTPEQLIAFADAGIYFEIVENEPVIIPDVVKARVKKAEEVQENIT